MAKIAIICLTAVVASCDRMDPPATTTTTTTSATLGTLVDQRDGHVYRTVRIGTQRWMAQNLDYDSSGSCYNDSESYCEIYGRFYSWTTAMALPDSFQNTAWNGTLPRRGICPAGWHVPSDSEWHVLVTYVDSPSAATVLKAKTGWRYSRWSWGSSNAIEQADSSFDVFGFSLLPSCMCDYPYSFQAQLWTSTQSAGSGARMRQTDDWDDSIYATDMSKDSPAALRCVGDP